MSQRIFTLFPALIVSATAAAADAPRVVTDFGPTQAIVSAVMGDLGAPGVLLTGQDNPHSFAMRPSHAEMLTQADLVIWVGHGLTPWLEDPLETLAETAVSLELLDTAGWDKLPLRGAHDHGAEHEDEHDDEHAHDAEHKDEHDDAHDHDADHEDNHDDAHDHDAVHGEEHDDNHDHDAEHEDEHDDAHDHDAEHEEEHDDEHHETHDEGDVDPHAWLDPTIAATWSAEIAVQLAAIDPENAATYTANATAFAAELDTLSADITAQMANVDSSTILFPHDSAQYFETRFDMAPGGYISESDAAAPGPAHLRELRETLVSGAITCVLSDYETSPGTITLLTEGTDVSTATLDLTNIAQTDYATFMRAFAETLATCD